MNHARRPAAEVVITMVPYDEHAPCTEHTLTWARVFDVLSRLPRVEPSRCMSLANNDDFPPSCCSFE
jgi:hypothetical protein